MDFYRYILICIFFVNIFGCANLQTISRTTKLPQYDETGKSGGVAIHLDAQQRLVIVNAFHQYCAEPSPDALAAYAASLGLGLAIPSQGEGSLAQSLQNSAGSIGLRTQSITLMRDALYRMCEAYSNGVIGDIQIATLLARSQDLTAVILAVEQLTGVVAANQVILSGGTGAGASASLLSNQKLLDAARKDEAEKINLLEEAKKERDTKQQAVNVKKAEVDTAAQNTQQLEVKKNELNILENELELAKQQVETKTALVAGAKKNREAIEDAKDSALTSAVSNTTTSGQFSVPVQRNQLSPEATKAIADAVEKMVTQVLQKEYTQESCMAYLSGFPRNFSIMENEEKKQYVEVQKLCLALIRNKFKIEENKLENN